MRFAPILIVLLALSACEEPLLYDPPPVGPRKAVWPDIPIPRGMEYLKGEGKATPAGDLRIYRMELRGGLDVKELCEFYENNLVLPVNGWTFESRLGAAPKAVTLVFTKKLERLSLVIRQESMRESVCEIRIDYNRVKTDSR